MKKSLIVSCLLLLVGCVEKAPIMVPSQSQKYEVPESFQVRNMKNIVQNQAAFNGNGHCGTCALGATAVWLSNNGYSNLPNDEIKTVLDLQKESNTDRHGTSTSGMIKGFKSYLKRYGYETNGYFYGGEGLKQSTYLVNFDFNQVKSDIANPHKFVFLLLGYYEKSTNYYTRGNGHWVVANGYEKYFLYLTDSGRSDGKMRKVGYEEENVTLRSERYKTSGKFIKLYMGPKDSETFVDGIVVFEIK